ncbi:spore germination protein [Halalkalibacter oceani]|uniref:spore germination protein n=1 Tax=Halalkalibacter oceani TaxID=1653776 RepID=UPI00339536B5
MSWFTLKKRLAIPTKQAGPEEPITTIIQQAISSSDFSHYQLLTPSRSVWLSFYHTLVDKDSLHEELIKKLQSNPFSTLEEIKTFVTLGTLQLSSDAKQVSDALMRGHVCLQLEECDPLCLLIPIPTDTKRDISIPEVEFSVVGPKESFVESLDVNIFLVRKRIPVPELRTTEFIIGNLSRSRVCVLYIESIANEENVRTMIQRVSDIQFDQVIDSSFINQMIEDNSLSPFPQFIDTERPDRVAAALSEGKVIVLVDGSPQAITGPTTLIEFFAAFEDYFMSWHIASVLRSIRLFSVWFSIFATPLYVSVLTYHAEIVPQDLLATIILSRSAIPFPPILEALFLEVTIELLREAGARLPTKVGQTIGIVGGIVIGTAAVEAGLTSNILLIIVALAALASFTTPVYRMGNTIRLLRFPFIIAAQLWGLIALSVLFCFLLIHLLTLSSLGRPYLAPLYPPRLADFKDAFYRLPFNFQSERPQQLQTKKSKRFNAKKAKKKKDIDEGL